MEKELTKAQHEALLEKWRRLVEAQGDFNWFLSYVKKELDIDDAWTFDQQTFKKFTKSEEETKP